MNTTPNNEYWYYNREAIDEHHTQSANILLWESRDGFPWLVIITGPS
ncbi:MAG TPA: hypothetical protein V6D07_12710 [Trichocoleus sp.]